MNKWLDEHQGTVWVYAMLYRPNMVGFHNPREGYLIVLLSDPIASHPDYPHGLARYSRELTADEVRTFQMRFLGTEEK